MFLRIPRISQVGKIIKTCLFEELSKMIAHLGELIFTYYWEPDSLEVQTKNFYLRNFSIQHQVLFLLVTSLVCSLSLSVFGSHTSLSLCYPLHCDPLASIAFLNQNLTGCIPDFRSLLFTLGLELSLTLYLLHSHREVQSKIHTYLSFVYSQDAYLKDARGRVLETEVPGLMQGSLGMTCGAELLMISKSHSKKT